MELSLRGLVDSTWSGGGIVAARLIDSTWSGGGAVAARLVDSTWSPSCPQNKKTPETGQGSESFSRRNIVYFLLSLGPDVDPALPPLADLPELPPVVAAPAAELLFLSLEVLAGAPSVRLMASLVASAVLRPAA